MIIYNVTCNVESQIAEEWLNWMKEVHIPEVMKCGIFTSCQMNKVLVSHEEGATFAIQYSCPTMKDLHNYQVNYSPSLQKKHSDKYGTKVVAFRTLLEKLEEFSV
jgi:hypothetical protein